ncbi:hypothetical protein CWB99_06695 [Pseudoalteromonas rubra]|uniref:Uncharacterized protein n=1 Tax=Pseudoalteromonas rubra TaxID=43658 RepID=A0A5S3WRR9_9GAMM|nr:hypothetical protein [Pseudoalteromonas rubra]TMP30423.1 hypothetical protein CWB99_06695 [Pseudoalteromonas rubra]TMP35447.1 hypothetical protein CWC00_04755 [Pseudoalteromonas rubra]
MDNHDFSDLAQLWQSTPASPPPALEKCIQRHKKQQLRLFFGIALETLIMLLVSAWFVQALQESGPLITQLWLGFGCVWGASMYALVNRSRLTSLRILKNQQLSQSLEAHQQLLRQELWRWDLSIKATLLFALALVFLILVQYAMSSIFLPNSLLGLLVVAVLLSVFKAKKRRARQVLKTLSE